MPDILQGPLTSLAFCWRIERSDGAGLGLTSHDRPLAVGGAYHAAAPGMLPSAIQRQAGLEPSDSEVAGVLSSDALDEQDLLLGRWDGARVELFAADWRNASVETVPLLKGNIGTIRRQVNDFAAELHGAAAKLSESVCPETSPECRAELGDRKCRVDLSGRTAIAKVEALDGIALVLDRSIGADFLWGRARYLSGGNCGLITVVVAVDGERIELRDMPRLAIAVGDMIELRHGCDKSFATCCDRFANAENFRGEPHLPGNDLLTRYPGS